MNNGLGSTARRARAKLSRTKLRGALQRDAKTARRLRKLRRRVDELEQEVQEARRLNRRVGELLDLVEELLLPVAQRDEAKVREFVERYSSTV